MLRIAPPGKTGLIVSVLFDYNLTKYVGDTGWYTDFKIYIEDCILNTLEASIYPGIRATILDRFSYTPLTIARVTGNTDGAETGWSFTNDFIPVEHRLPRLYSATPAPLSASTRQVNGR